MIFFLACIEVPIAATAAWMASWILYVMKLRYVWRMTIAIAALSSLAACSSVDSVCRPGLAPMHEAELFFGRNIGDVTAVSEQDWQRFVAEEITPRFPNGFTIEDATGQWKGANSVIVREPSKRVTIVLQDVPKDWAALEEIRDAYKQRFHQDSVLIQEYRVCGSF